MKRVRFKGLLTVLGVFGLIVLGYYSRDKVDWAEVLRILGSIPASLVFGLVILQLFTLSINTFIWGIPFTHGRCWSLRTFLRFFLITNSAGLVEAITPSSKFGGEAVKVVLIKKVTGYSLKQIVPIFLTIKLIVLLPLIIVFPVLFGYYGYSSVHIDGVVVLTGLMLCIVLGWLLFPRITKKLKFQKQRIKGWILFGLSLIMWALYPIKFLIVAQAIGIEQSAWSVIVATFLAYGISILPLSPGGLGTFEVTLAFTLQQSGLPIELGLSLAAITRLFTFGLPLVLSIISAIVVSLVPWTWFQGGSKGYAHVDYHAGNPKSQLEMSPTPTIEIKETSTKFLLSKILHIEFWCTKWETLGKFYTRLFYTSLVRRELDLAAVQQPNKIAHIGSGPYPMTALTVAEMGYSIDCFDINDKAIDCSRSCIQKYGLTKQIRVQNCSHSCPDYQEYQIVFLSLHVIGKKAIIHSLLNSLSPGAKIIYRNPTGFMKRFYATCDPQEFSGTKWDKNKQTFFKESIVLTIPEKSA